MPFQTAAGATLGVSAALPATYDQLGYAALTYTNVGEVVNLGTFGREYNTVTFLPLAERGASKVKGSFDNGRFEPQIALDLADAGQVIMAAALTSDNNYAFEIDLTSGDTFYLTGLVNKFAPMINTVDDVVMRETIIDVSREAIVEDAA